jgi:hypothetical protein
MLRLLTLTPLTQALHMATALAHTAPGVVLRLDCTGGDTIAVGYGRLGPHLTPCQMRSALVGSGRPGVPHLAATVRDVDIVSGLDHLGGGLYGSGRGATGSQRWFATPLPHHAVVAIAAEHPIDIPDELCAVNVMADSELAVCTVRLVAAPELTHRLDEIAYWLLSRCLVSELLDSLDAETHQRP